MRALVGLMLLIGAGGCAKEIVAHGQDEANANNIKLLLSEVGVEAEKMKDEESREPRYNVAVGKDEANKSYAILKRHDLPHTPKLGTADLAAGTSLIPTSQQEKAKREVGIAGDIANALRRVPRVVEAMVEVSIPDDNPLRDVNEAKPKPKISVLVIFLPDAENKAPISVEDVQRFAQGGLPEMKSSEVSVQMIPQAEGGNLVKPAADSGGAPVGANACEKTRVLGIDVCVDYRGRLLNTLIVSVVLFGVLAGMAVLSVLRALRYRKDLTRLTAQVAQLRK